MSKDWVGRPVTVKGDESRVWKVAQVLESGEVLLIGFGPNNKLTRQCAIDDIEEHRSTPLRPEF